MHARRNKRHPGTRPQPTAGEIERETFLQAQIT